MVDDNWELADNLAEIFAGAGHEALACHSADEALEQCRGQQFDLALLDIRMNGMDGLKLCRSLRRMRTARRCVFMTAYSVESQLSTAFELSGLPVLAKPLDIGRLIELAAS